LRVAKARVVVEDLWHINLFRGTRTRDFWLLVSFINLLLLSPQLLCYSHFKVSWKWLRYSIQVSSLVINFSPVSLTPAVNLSPMSLTPVINYRFHTVIDVDMVIATYDKFMTKVVENGCQIIACVVNTKDKCIWGHLDGHK